jgi:hypothetical protein
MALTKVALAARDRRSHVRSQVSRLAARTSAVTDCSRPIAARSRLFDAFCRLMTVGSQAHGAFQFCETANEKVGGAISTYYGIVMIRDVAVSSTSATSALQSS